MSDGSDRSDFEEKLWRSAQEEKPAASVQERALAAALAAGGGGGGGGSNAPPSPNAALGAKGAALGWKLAAAAAVIAGAAAIFATSRPSEKRAPAVPVVATGPSPAVSAPMLEAPAAPQTATPPPSEPSAATPEPAAPVPAPVRAPSPSAPRALTLADEVAAIDAARASLARGDTTGALRALDGYDRTFPRGKLAPEAAALRARANRALPTVDGGGP